MNETEWEFMKSPYFVPEDENWHLTEDAPPEIVAQFEEYMAYKKEMEEMGVD